jgi:two-component system response regulator
MIGEEAIEILLVEDNPDDVELTRLAFAKSKLSNRLSVVRDGVEALAYLFCTDEYAHRRIEDNPRIVLLDLKLPNLDGLEVLRQLKSDPRTQTIPVIMLTASAEERDIVESYRLGVNSYIVKPIDFQQFTDAVGQLGLYWLLLNRPPAPHRPGVDTNGA